MKHAGFTLIELLIVVALVAILANVATPSFKQLIDSNRGLVAAQELASGIRSARVAAITRNQIVTIHAIEEDWSNGWRIILDLDGKGPDEKDTLLVERASGGTPRVVGNSKVTERLSFNGLGNLRNRTNGTFHVCLEGQPVSHYRVIVAPTGRVRIEDTKRDVALCG
ncbi:Type IV pilus bioproteinsis protein [Pseudomonas syringae pv. antirrhini]|uniref:Type II secretion system protein H n=1 Tax=Pseudomonas syringae pv. antirrhini TaxID=251702 RepID=A0A0P9K493_9PSED|nr:MULTISPECIES: GspH/FimT family pseudopilin [Pseudomonas]KPW49919.1 Type IV pilus bioproteinsis protein [Pseudomonas syringae pv. antirrhini]RMP38068.1 Type IV pilus bioproteinsis protein [Pseudomonas syringae pv. antirrhini]RMP44133.1 Type IV pilus bioproteinsis protein [Pseudomonas syringae pv. antirrhini]RMW30234.1 Type IV pilus bioproteinsis protein [Pseudomonas syringae pv. antirrhini]WIN07930.1 GspH/FimT family pseudopilin [Pseudomonas syringae pv. antirrhini str. 126]